MARKSRTAPRKPAPPGYAWGRLLQAILEREGMNYTQLAQIIAERTLKPHAPGQVQARATGYCPPPHGALLHVYCDALRLTGDERKHFERIALIEQMPEHTRHIVAELGEQLAARDRNIACLERAAKALGDRLDALEAQHPRVTNPHSDRFQAPGKLAHRQAESVQPGVLVSPDEHEAMQESLFGGSALERRRG